MSVHRNIITNYSQQDATFLEFIYFCRRSTCFRRSLRPSSGAHNCKYSFRYCQPTVLLAATVEEMELHSISSTVADSSSIGWQYLKLYLQLCSRWWAERPPETCRASAKINKLKKSCILLAVICNYSSYDYFLLTVAVKDIVMNLKSHYIIFFQCISAVKVEMGVTPVLHVWRDLNTNDWPYSISLEN